jgi:diadenylate cyclase
MYSWSSWSEWFWRFGRPGYGLANVLLEWFLIGSVVYLCVRFLRGTRGSRVFVGVSVVLVSATLLVKLVAEQLNLERIKVLYPDFVLGMFLVALVVFQPELRRGLMRLGEARWLLGWTREVDRLIDELCRAAAYLSKNKIGALVALERDVPLGAVAAGGVRLDAELSAELLMTIFWPGSALHDLGVIVQAGRVAAAGCQFPLVESEELESTIGSRHRAAVGLSQESDAVIVVISEETGTISIAERGRLLRPLTVESLHLTLHEMLSSRKSETPEPRRGPSLPAVRSATVELKKAAT